MTFCGNGSYQSECYAASIDWKASGLSATQTVAFQTEIAAGRGLIRGTFTTRSYPEAGSMTIFAATEAWRAASANPPGGTFFRLTDNGIRCATTPCFWIHGARLNSPVDREISSLDLGAAGITAERSRTLLSTVGARGFLAAGTLKSVAREGPAGDGVRLIASQVYLRVQP
jgi:hypothetical protein